MRSPRRPYSSQKSHVHLVEILQALRRRDFKSAEAALVAALSYSERAMNLLMDMDRSSTTWKKQRNRRV